MVNKEKNNELINLWRTDGRAQKKKGNKRPKYMDHEELEKGDLLPTIKFP